MQCSAVQWSTRGIAVLLFYRLSLSLFGISFLFHFFSLFPISYITLLRNSPPSPPSSIFMYFPSLPHPLLPRPHSPHPSTLPPQKKKNINPQPQERLTVQSTMEALRAMLRPAFPGCAVECYGSSANGLSLRGGNDIDVTRALDAFFVLYFEILSHFLRKMLILLRNPIMIGIPWGLLNECCFWSSAAFLGRKKRKGRRRK